MKPHAAYCTRLSCSCTHICQLSIHAYYTSIVRTELGWHALCQAWQGHRPIRVASCHLTPCGNGRLRNSRTVSMIRMGYCMQTCLAKTGADLSDWEGAACSPGCHVSRHQSAHWHTGVPSLCLRASTFMTVSVFSS